MNGAALDRFSRAVQTLHECDSARQLGPTLLTALQTLCDADSHVVNAIGFPGLEIYASTMEFSQVQMETFNAHLAEHPLLGIIEKARAGEVGVGKWSDHTTLREFRQKALYQDFFRGVGVTRQMASTVQVNPEATLGLSLNRRGRDFQADDVLLLEQLVPHVRQLIVRLIAQGEAERALALREMALGEEAVLVVNDAGLPLFISEAARCRLRDYFPGFPSGNLPGPLRAWLRRCPAEGGQFQHERRGRRLLGRAGPLVPGSNSSTDEVMGRPGKRLVRCLHLEEQHTHPSLFPLTRLGLTTRESEVLHWMTEGKRNGEIALILGISDRTVDKHCENIFQKLQVETRTAAVRVAVESLRVSAAAGEV